MISILKKIFANKKINIIICLSSFTLIVAGLFSYVYFNRHQSDIISVNHIKDSIKSSSYNLNPTQGVDTNIIAMILAVSKSESAGIKVEIVSSTSNQISKTGVITYGNSKVTVNIVVKLTENGVISTYKVSIVIPAKSNAVVAIPNKASATPTKASSPATSTPVIITTPVTTTTIPTAPAVNYSSVNAKNYGAKGDESTDDTVAIQSAVDYAGSNAVDIVFIPDGTYLINPDISINMKSNVALVLSSGAILKSTASGSQRYAIIQIDGIKNVSITGGKIIGDRNIHTGSGGEWGMGVNIVNNSSSIYVTNITISNCWGDGVYIGGDTSSGVNIDNIVSDNNRRQGLSITNANNVTISNSTFSNTNGTLPESGIDVEPNSGQTAEDIKIKNVKLTGNKGYGLVLLGINGIVRRIETTNSTMSGNTEDGVAVAVANDLVFSNDIITNNYYGLRLMRDINNATISGMNISNNKYFGILMVSDKQSTGIENVTIKDSTISNNSQQEPGATDGVFIDNYDSTGYIRNIGFMNTKFIDNQTTHTQKYGLNVSNSSTISGILLYADCVFSGNTSAPLNVGSSVTQNVPR